MRATINRRAFLAAAKTAAVPTGVSHLTVLGGVHVEATSAGLTLTSTNLDLACTVDVAADVASKGRVIVPSAVLGRFLAAGAADTVTIETSKTSVTVSCGETVVELRPIPVDQWPNVEPVAAGDEAFLSAEDLSLVGRVVHAALTDTKARLNAPALAGVHFTGRRVEATDRYRLAAATVNVDLPDVVVPLDTIRRVTSAAADAEGVTVTASRTAITFATDRMSWTSRLVNHDFPNIESFLAADPPHKLRVATGELRDAVARMLVIDDDKHHVSVTHEGGKLVVANEIVDVGSISDVVACTGDYGQSIWFDSKYLADALDAVGDDMVTLELHDSLKPCRIRSADSRLTLVVMPIRPATS